MSDKPVACNDCATEGCEIRGDEPHARCPCGDFTSKQNMTEDTFGLDTYGYPKVDIMKGTVRITLGWFFVGEDEDEPASYVEQWIDTKGKQRFVIDVNLAFNFDFVTKLKDYGFWADHGFGKFWVYADHHIRIRDKVNHFIKNTPFRTKQWMYWHLPFYRSVSRWRYQRYCKRILA